MTLFNCLFNIVTWAVYYDVRSPSCLLLTFLTSQQTVDTMLISTYVLLLLVAPTFRPHYLARLGLSLTSVAGYRLVLELRQLGDAPGDSRTRADRAVDRALERTLPSLDFEMNPYVSYELAFPAGARRGKDVHEVPHGDGQAEGEDLLRENGVPAAGPSRHSRVTKISNEEERGQSEESHAFFTMKHRTVARDVNVIPSP
jgi:hypothetical protein